MLRRRPTVPPRSRGGVFALRDHPPPADARGSSGCHLISGERVSPELGGPEGAAPLWASSETHGPPPQPRFCAPGRAGCIDWERGRGRDSSSRGARPPRLASAHHKRTTAHRPEVGQLSARAGSASGRCRKALLGGENAIARPLSRRPRSPCTGDRRRPHLSRGDGGRCLPLGHAAALPGGALAGPLSLTPPLRGALEVRHPVLHRVRGRAAASPDSLRVAGSLPRVELPSSSRRSPARFPPSHGLI